MKRKKKKPGCRANYRENGVGSSQRGVALRRGEEAAPRWLRDSAFYSEENDDEGGRREWRGPEGRRGWRHGDSRLAFNVPHGVRRGYQRGGSVRVAADSKRAQARERRFFCSPCPSSAHTVIDEKVTKESAKREKETRERISARGGRARRATRAAAGRTEGSASEKERERQQEGVETHKYSTHLSLTCYVRSVREAATCREHASATNGP